MCWRTWGVRHGFSHDRIYYAFDMRADQLLVGCALAAWLAERSARHPIKVPRYLPELALVILLGTTVAGTGTGWVFRAFVPLVISVASSSLILGLIASPTSVLSRAFSAAPLIALGRVSYGIYLWHWPLLLEARFFWPDSKSAAVMAILASIPIAFASYHLLERPFLRLKRRFERGADGPALDAETVELSRQNVVGTRNLPSAGVKS